MENQQTGTIFLFPKSADPEGKGNIIFGYFDNVINKLLYYRYEEGIYPPTKVTEYALSGEEDFNYFARSIFAGFVITGIQSRSDSWA